MVVYNIKYNILYWVLVGYNIKYNILYWELVGYNSKATLFNKAGLIYDEKRSKLLSEKAEKLVYLCDIFESEDDDSTLWFEKPVIGNTALVADFYGIFNVSRWRLPPRHMDQQFIK